MAKIEFGFYPMQTGHYDPTLPDIMIEIWHKNAGDKVKKDEPILSYETDKVSGDMLSPASGVIVEIYAEYFKNSSLWESGRAEVLPDGRILYRPALGIIETEPDLVGMESKKAGGEKDLETKKKDKEETRQSAVFVSTPAKKMASESGISINDVIGHFPDLRRIQKEDVERFLQYRIPIVKDDGGNQTSLSGLVPMARNLLQMSGIDPKNTGGSGPGGLIIASDAEKSIAARVSQTVDDADASGVSGKRSEIRIPDNVALLKPSREWLTVAHNLEKGSRSVIAGGEPLNEKFEEYDLGPLIRFKQEDGYLFEKAFGVRLRLWAPVAMAVVDTLKMRDFWIFNGYWHIEDENDRARDKVALYKSVNLGMSYDRGVRANIDMENGTISGQRLRILTLHSADKMGVIPFYAETDELVSRADYDRQNAGGKLEKTTIRDWSGWTFIFNNVGAARHARGNSLFTPGISAMFNMGAVRSDGKANFQIFFDHRMIDGVISTDFIDAIYDNLVRKIIPTLRKICYQK